MSSSSVRTFMDPDEYAAALRQGPVELTLKQSGSFAARLCTVELLHLSMQRLLEELARTTHVNMREDRAFIAFRTQCGPPVVRNGIELTTDGVARLRPGQSYYQNTSGPTSHAGISLPLEEMDALCTTAAGCDPTPTNDDVMLTPVSPDTASSWLASCALTGARRSTKPMSKWASSALWSAA